MQADKNIAVYLTRPTVLSACILPMDEIDAAEAPETGKNTAL